MPKVIIYITNSKVFFGCLSLLFLLACEARSVDSYVGKLHIDYVCEKNGPRHFSSDDMMVVGITKQSEDSELRIGDTCSILADKKGVSSYKVTSSKECTLSLSLSGCNSMPTTIWNVAFEGLGIYLAKEADTSKITIVGGGHMDDRDQPNNFFNFEFTGYPNLWE